MARAYYTCSCGNRVSVGGKNVSAAERFAEDLKKRGVTCRDCDQKRFDAENAAALAEARAAGLPELTGTPKQIAWAASIRKVSLPAIEAGSELLLQDLRRQLAQYAPGDHLAACESEVTDAVALIVTEMRSRTSAKSWIDHPLKSAAKAQQAIEDELWRRRATLIPQCTRLMDL